ncbi:MAG: class I SAM-dependent methyltransferase [Pirellulales bacterium]
MLQRTLEPERMDGPGEAQAYDAMDHTEVNRRFVDDLLTAWPLESPDQQEWIDVLDLGTGTARIPLELCQRVESVRVMAADAAVGMLEQARLNIEIAGLTERIQLDQIDARQLRYQDGQFDAVICNSLIHHLADPAPVIAEAIRVTKPGGVLFFRDLLRPPDEAALARLVHQYAGDEQPPQRKLLRESLHAALTLQEIRELVQSQRYDPKGVRTTSDRHWSWFTRKRS